MRRPRLVAALAVVLSLGVGTLAGAAPAAADGPASIALGCSVPLLGDYEVPIEASATDSVDPVEVGGTVVNTITIPIPDIGGELPVQLPIEEIRLITPIPAGVTVTGVTFTPSAFTPTWSVNGNNLVTTLTGTIAPGAGGTTIAPDVQIATVVAGPPRTISWTVPSSILVKVDTTALGLGLGVLTVTCTPTDLGQVVLTTTVRNGNQVPVAADQTVTTDRGTPTPVTLSAVDGDGDPLTYTVTSGPAHGTLSGTAPNMIYTPAAGYVGPDSFQFTASDGTASDTGTVSITVKAVAPGAPTGVAATAHAGAVALSWAPPASDGGSTITGYRITPVRNGTALAPVSVGAAASAVVDVPDGQPLTFRVAAVNGVGTGPDSVASAAVTPQPWLPFTSASTAVDRTYRWMLGRAPTANERSTWVGRIQTGTHQVADLIVFLRSDALSTGVIDPVTRLYQAYFLRVPDRDGITYWVSQRQNGWSLFRVSDYFARSAEFRTLYGNLSNQRFVEQVYRNILGRDGEPSGIAYWTAELNSGRRTRGSVMIGFSEAAEYRGRQSANVDAGVLVIYLEGRTPSSAERQALATLVSSRSLREAARAELRSPAVIARARA